MANKKKYHKLDDVGIVGKQEKKSTTSQNYHKKKTGDALRQAREHAGGVNRLKKAS